MGESRKAKVGETITVLSGRMYHMLKKGEKAVVLDADRFDNGEAIRVKSLERDLQQTIRHIDYEVEAVAELKIGDKARIKKLEDTMQDFEVGDVVEIVGYSYGERLRFEKKGGWQPGYGNPESLEPVKFLVGDKVEVTGNGSEGINHFLDEGDTGTIESFSSNGHPLVNTGRDRQYVAKSDLKRAEETKEDEGMAKFNDGDKVKIVGNGEGLVVHFYDIGEIGEVRGGKSTHYEQIPGIKYEVYVGDKRQTVSEQHLELLVEVEADELEIGDKFYYVDPDGELDWYLTAGKIYEVTGFDSVGDAQILDDEGDELDADQHDSRIKMIRVEKGEAPKTATKFKVGDIVKGTHPSRYNITNDRMTKGEVIKVRGTGKFDVKIIEHDSNGWVGDTYIDLEPEVFELADEEVKVSEPSFNGIKVGDIVTLVDDSQDLDSLIIGNTYVVQEIDEDDEDMPYRINGLWVYADEVVKGEKVTKKDDVVAFLTKLDDSELLDLIEEVRNER